MWRKIFVILQCFACVFKVYFLGGKRHSFKKKQQKNNLLSFNICCLFLLFSIKYKTLKLLKLKLWKTTHFVFIYISENHLLYLWYFWVLMNIYVLNKKANKQVDVDHKMTKCTCHAPICCPYYRWTFIEPLLFQEVSIMITVELIY